jgi:glycosyltransferase involved in cell wall biosynthesis
MPVYNNERYFPLAARSVLSQEYKDLELIIIDDGSTDKTPIIADLIAKEDRRVRVVHQKNQWIYASLNNGIQIAKGDYVYIVNSDDRLRPGSLKNMAEKVEYFHPDVIWTKVLTHMCDDTQRIIAYDCNNVDKKIEKDMLFENADEFRDNWIFLNKSGLTNNQVNLYKRNIVKKYKFKNDIYGADKLFNISIASEIRSSFVLKEAVYDHFNYKCDEMNASIGKYYGYEHEMFNLFYNENRKLLSDWNRLDNEALYYLASTRLRELSIEFRSFNNKSCTLSLEEKIEKIFNSYLEKNIYEIAVESEKLEELEARVLSGMRELFIREELSPQSDFYFTYELIESLLIYEKDKDDYAKIKNAIYHPFNKYHIGQCFYKKLIGDMEDV